jgi:hypothetical protein
MRQRRATFFRSAYETLDQQITQYTFVAMVFSSRQSILLSQIDYSF